MEESGSAFVTWSTVDLTVFNFYKSKLLMIKSDYRAFLSHGIIIKKLILRSAEIVQMLRHVYWKWQMPVWFKQGPPTTSKSNPWA